MHVLLGKVCSICLQQALIRTRGVDRHRVQGYALSAISDTSCLMGCKLQKYSRSLELSQSMTGLAAWECLNTTQWSGLLCTAGR